MTADKPTDELTAFFLKVIELMPKAGLPRERLAKSAGLNRNQIDLYVSRRKVAEDVDRQALLDGLAREIAAVKEAVAAAEVGLAREQDAERRRLAAQALQPNRQTPRPVRRSDTSSRRRRGSS